MGNERVDLGFGGDALEDFDPNDWVPNADKTANDRPKAEETQKAAQAAGFTSRESKPATKTDKLVRRRRTGRDTQFNMRTKAETKQAFYDIADANDWGLGETLEKAVELLEKEYGQGV
jgi:hypothetical protein